MPPRDMPAPAKAAGTLRIRPYEPADEPALYEICLRTGDHGGDATSRYQDPELLGHVYVGPYLALAPELAFVLDGGDGAVGYVLGAADTAEFERRCEAEWWPALRRRYPDPPPTPPRNPDEAMLAMIHEPSLSSPTVTARYPSHLHIDLLPPAQGHGHGRALIERLLEALTAAGSTGVHLGVSRSNEKAIGFYHRLGFVEIVRYAGALVLARPL